MEFQAQSFGIGVVYGISYDLAVSEAYSGSRGLRISSLLTVSNDLLRTLTRYSGASLTRLNTSFLKASPRGFDR